MSTGAHPRLHRVLPFQSVTRGQARGTYEIHVGRSRKASPGTIIGRFCGSFGSLQSPWSREIFPSSRGWLSAMTLNLIDLASESSQGNTPLTSLSQVEAHPPEQPLRLDGAADVEYAPAARVARSLGRGLLG